MRPDLSPLIESEYRTYVSQSPFTNVTGMTPRTKTGGTSAGVPGLTNGETCNLAVTAVNLSGGEGKEVTARTAYAPPESFFPALEPGETYSWRVLANGICGPGYFSKPRRFVCAGDSESTVTVTSPAQGDTLGHGDTATIQWDYTGIRAQHSK